MSGDDICDWLAKEEAEAEEWVVPRYYQKQFAAARAEIERLRAAGDALAAAYTDAIFEEDGHPEMDEDLTAWNEARRD